MSKEINNQKVNNNDCYTLLPTVLDEIIEYIEQSEFQINQEFAVSTDKDYGKMPEIYDKLIALKNGG